VPRDSPEGNDPDQSAKNNWAAYSSQGIAYSEFSGRRKCGAPRIGDQPAATVAELWLSTRQRKMPVSEDTAENHSPANRPVSR